MFIISWGVLPGKLFQPSLMFVDKSRRLNKRGEPERHLTQVVSKLAHKHQTRLTKAFHKQALQLIMNIRKLWP